jgi:hypothetical protein
MANTVYKTKILLRTDTTANWTSKNPILKLGEMGFAIDNGVVVGGKVGMETNWNSTPFHFTAFKPIVTNYGRDLNHPGGPYDAHHNFQEETAAWEYVLNPYAPPSIAATNVIYDAEVGDIYYNAEYPFGFTVYNTPSLFLEKMSGETVDSKVYYVNPNTPAQIAGGTGTKYKLTDQVNGTATQEHKMPVYANMNATGAQLVFTAYVRGKKNPTDVNSVYPASSYVRFRIRSAAFLWKANSSLLSTSLYNDAQLSSIVKNIGGDVHGVRHTNMADGGGIKYFNDGNTITWNTPVLLAMNPLPPAAVGNDGFFNMVIAAPKSAGIPIMYNPSAGPESPMTLIPRDFMYSNGTANDTTAIPYTLYVSESKITGTQPVKIV